MRKNEMNPIGFRAIRDNQLPAPVQNIQNTKNMQDNRFADAIMKSIGEFLDEEFRNCCYTTERLVKKIEASRLLFDKDKKELSMVYKKQFPDGRGL